MVLIVDEAIADRDMKQAVRVVEQNFADEDARDHIPNYLNGTRYCVVKTIERGTS